MALRAPLPSRLAPPTAAARSARFRRSRLLNYRPIFHIIGILLLALAGFMLIPALADLFVANPDWQRFLAASAITTVAAGLLIFSTRGTPIDFGLREAFFLTTASWVLLSGFAALPFIFSERALSYTDAFFETISGLTTTGSTVLVGLDAMPPGILLWRALLQWIGGVGIIVMGMAILPFLRVGGMQLFRTESSDRSDKIFPRPGQIAGTIGLVYVGLTLLCMALYDLAGMTAFEGLAHAMTTLSTGGYSTSDGSLGHFSEPAVHWIGTVFMLAGGLPFVLYVRALTGKPHLLWRNGQVRALLATLGTAILILALWLIVTGRQGPLDALRLAAFNVTSIVTTTGFATADYGTWGAFAVVLFFTLTFVGACTGSTSGAVKIFRFEVMGRMAFVQFRRLQYPRGVFPITYMGRTVEPEVSLSVIAFFATFIGSFIGLALSLSLLGLDFVTAFSGAATAIANVGPGLGPIIGPAGNFSTLPDAAKWLLSAGMLLGRLEIFTVFVLFLPGFWRE